MSDDQDRTTKTKNSRWINTRVRWEWIDGELVEVESEGYEYDGPLALAHNAPLLDQDSYRWRYEDGDETTATWAAAANTAIVVPYKENGITSIYRRVRFLIQETAGGNERGVSFPLYYRVNAGAWTPVTTTSSPVRAATLSELVNDADTTQQLGVNTFVTPNGGQVEDGVHSTAIDLSSEEVEIEYALRLYTSSFTTSDTIELQVRRADGSVIESYTNNASVTRNNNVEIAADPPSAHAVTAAPSSSHFGAWAGAGVELINQDVVITPDTVAVKALTTHGGEYFDRYNSLYGAGEQPAFLGVYPVGFSAPTALSNATINGTVGVDPLISNQCNAAAASAIATITLEEGTGEITPTVKASTAASLAASVALAFGVAALPAAATTSTHTASVTAPVEITNTTQNVVASTQLADVVLDVDVPGTTYGSTSTTYQAGVALNVDLFPDTVAYDALVNIAFPSDFEAWYSFDEGTGTATVDAASPGIDGTLSTTALWSGIPRVGDNSVEANGSGIINLNTSTNPFSIGDEYTFTAWVYKRNTSTLTPLLDVGAQVGPSNAENVGLLWMLQTDGTVISRVVQNDATAGWNGEQWGFWRSTIAVPNNEWALIFVIRDLTKATLYIYTDSSGWKKETITYASQSLASWSNRKNVILGASLGATDVTISPIGNDVIVDEIGIFSRVLTNKERFAVSNGGTGASPTARPNDNLVVNYAYVDGVLVPVTAATQQATLVYDVDVPTALNAATTATFQPTFTYDVDVPATKQNAAVAKHAPELVYDVNVLANTANVTADGIIAAFGADTTVVAKRKNTLAATFDASLTENTEVLANTKSATAVAQQATLTYDVEVLTGTASAAAATIAASTAADENVLAQPSASTAAAQQATLTYDVAVLQTTQQAAAAAQQATLTYDVEVLTTTSAATTATHQASFIADSNIDAVTAATAAATHQALLAADINVGTTTKAAAAATHTATLQLDVEVVATTKNVVGSGVQAQTGEDVVITNGTVKNYTAVARPATLTYDAAPPLVTYTVTANTHTATVANNASAPTNLKNAVAAALQAGVAHDINVGAVTYLVTAAEVPPLVSFDRTIEAGTAAATADTFVTTFVADAGINPAEINVVTSAHPAEISHDINVFAALEAVSAAPHGATIVYGAGVFAVVYPATSTTLAATIELLQGQLLNTTENVVATALPQSVFWQRAGNTPLQVMTDALESAEGRTPELFLVYETVDVEFLEYLAGQFEVQLVQVEDTWIELDDGELHPGPVLVQSVSVVI